MYFPDPKNLLSLIWGKWEKVKRTPPSLSLSFPQWPFFPPQVLLLCGSAYRPTEEIDLRSIGWGNIFQLPFKHMRDYRLRYLLLFFIYSGFEVLFLCTDFTLVRVNFSDRRD